MEQKADADLSLVETDAVSRQPVGPRPVAEAVMPADMVSLSPGGPGPKARRRALQLIAVALLMAACAGGLLLLPQAAPPSAPAQTPVLFKDWGQPEVALVLSGQQHGYLKACGCSNPQYGGLGRRYTFMQGLKDRGWPIVAVDLGDIAQRSGPYAQRLDKYVTSMQALQKMDYLAVGLGQNEMALGTLGALSHFSLNEKSPRVLASNLLNRDEVFVDTVGAWVVGGKNGTPRVAVTALISPTVTKQVNDPDVKLHPKTGVVIEETLRDIKAKAPNAALTVLLCQASLDEAVKCATFCASLRKEAPTLPRIDVILCLTAEDLAPSETTQAGESIIVRVGQKGKSIGVVGAFRKGNGYQLRYQMVELGPQYDTPEGQEAGNPIMALMEEYARRVKDKNYMAAYRQVAHAVQMGFPKSTYVGSDKCRACHKEAFNIWKGTNHFHAYESLEKAKHPSLRQYDGECVQCHVVGFGYTGGFTNEERTPHLKNVGCESCHGPASEHIKNPDDVKLRALLNPWKAQPNETVQLKHHRELQIDRFCQKCHDTDNDVHWSFEKNWPKVVHSTPQAAQPNVVPAAPPAPNIQAIPPAVPQQPIEAKPTSSGRRFFRRDN